MTSIILVNQSLPGYAVPKDISFSSGLNVSSSGHKASDQPNRESSGSFISLGIPKIPDDANLAPQDPPEDTCLVSHNVEKKNFMGEFFLISQNLSQQLAHISSSRLTVNLQTLLSTTGRTSNSISAILESANTFLDISKRYSKFLDSLDTNVNFLSSPRFPSSTTHNTVFAQQTATSTSFLSHSNITITDILLILNCHTQILQIYNIIYHHIHQTFLSDPSIPPSLPGFHFKGSPIKSGQLQIMVLTSEIIRLNYGIEQILGIPNAFTFTGMEEDDGDEGRGVFSENRCKGVKGLVEVVLRREEVGEVVKGRGGVKRLRELIRGIKELMNNIQIGLHRS